MKKAMELLQKYDNKEINLAQTIQGLHDLGLSSEKIEEIMLSKQIRVVCGLKSRSVRKRV